MSDFLFCLKKNYSIEIVESKINLTLNKQIQKNKNAKTDSNDGN